MIIRPLLIGGLSLFLQPLLEAPLHAVQAQEGFVRVERCPDDGIQPRAVVDPEGRMHLLYFKGDTEAGDLFYSSSEDFGESYSTPLRVNSQERSVDATQGLRGGAFALGRGGRVHVAWVGSSTAEPSGPGGEIPLLYSSLDLRMGFFSEQRNLIEERFGLTARPGVAADVKGNVYLFWHAPSAAAAEVAEADGKENAALRRVFMVKSSDDGQTFGAAIPVDREGHGASESCALAACSATDGTVYVFYRAAIKGKSRDMRLLSSTDGSEEFKTVFVDNWKRRVCPETTCELRIRRNSVYASFEGRGVVYGGPIDPETDKLKLPLEPKDKETWRRRPSAAALKGIVCMAWIEAPKGESKKILGWQLFNVPTRTRIDNGIVEELPIDSTPTVVPRPNGFTVLY